MAKFRSHPLLVLPLLPLLLMGLGACGGDELQPLNPEILTRGIITGVVRDRDAPGEPPVAGAEVQVLPNNQVTETDSQGRFTFVNLLPGSYRVRALRPGNTFGSSTTAGTQDEAQPVGEEEVQLASGQTRDIQLEFGRAPGTDSGFQITFVSSNNSKQIQVTTVLGTDVVARDVNSVPAPILEAKLNPANPQEMVLECSEAGNSGIYLANLSTQSGSVLVQTGVPETHPDFSPDGSRVVYSADGDSDGNFEIYVINRDGSGQTLLVDDFDPTTSGTFDHRDPAWSPDGTTILFVSRRTDAAGAIEESDYEVVSVPATGGAIREHTRDLFDDRDPAWHPNSISIAYAKQAQGTFDLFETTILPRSIEVRWTNDFFEDRDPSYSVDGRFLTWITRTSIQGGNADGSTEIAVGQRIGTEILSRRLRTDNPASVTLRSPDFRPRLPFPPATATGQNAS